MWFDNHCHLTMLPSEAAVTVEKAEADGVTHLLTVGCTVEDSQGAAEVASHFDRVWSTAGVHPHEAEHGIDGLEDLLDNSSVVAVGECGLDYFYDHSPRDTQAEVFARQIELAHQHDLALVIHTRDAWDDTFDILDRQGIPERTVFHCFTGGPTEVEEALKRGAYVSFSGIVTFKTAEELRAAARIVPLDRLVVETDSPYLAPVPFRGKPNHPGNVAVVGAFLADLLDVDEAEMARITTANAKTLYQL